jgi:nucleotide-binding universal stress UspA family protein
MKHFKHILCPYDFSEFSDEAVHYAVKMADEDTEITIISVVELFYNNYPEGIIYFDQMTQAHSKEALIKYVEKLQNYYPNLKFKYVLEMDNDAVKIILDYHKKYKSDLIVIASHGRKPRIVSSMHSTTSFSTSCLLRACCSIETFVVLNR